MLDTHCSHQIIIYINREGLPLRNEALEGYREARQKKRVIEKKGLLFNKRVPPIGFSFEQNRRNCPTCLIIWSGHLWFTLDEVFQETQYICIGTNKCSLFLFNEIQNGF